jgi:sensor domain CHASE-containing protein
MVVWRAKARAKTAQALARTEAQALGASLEVQFNQAATAAEVLGALARQGGGGLANFQKVATELLAAHPGLASLELQPGGIVSDIVPRAGHERAVGFNVLKDAGQRAGANDAIARRGLSVAGPVTLDRGELGLVARVPVFQRALDGRDSFWGFVAVSMRLHEALGRAQVNNLPRQGYSFTFFAPASAQQKATAIAWHGLSSLQDTIQQPVRAQNLEFRLALKRQGGWVDKTKLVFELLTVFLLSGLVSLLANLLESRHAVEAELTEATQRLARETAERSQAQTDSRGAKERVTAAQTELKQVQLALQQAESKAAQFQARLEAGDRAKEEATRASQAELKEAQAALQKAQETIAQLQARLDAAVKAQKDATSAGQERLRQNQAALAELQARLEAAMRPARESAEASAARLAELEQSNRDLKARLLVAERAEARVAELNGLLEKAQQGSSNDANSAPAPEAVKATAEVAPLPEPSVTQKAAKAVKRKRARRNNQMDLFGNVVPAVRATAEPVPKTADGALDAKEPKSSTTEMAASFETPASDQPKAPTDRGESQASLQEGSKRPGPKPEPTPEPETAGTEVQPASGATPLEPAAAEDFTASESLANAEDDSKLSRPKTSPARRLPAAPPVEPAQLRKAVSQILPLLAERDPGAKDCLRDNRTTFRSAFTPEAYVEFEELVKKGDFEAALEQLTKAARKHGINP